MMQITDEMVEAGARAICIRSWSGITGAAPSQEQVDADWRSYAQYMRVGLQAALSSTPSPAIDKAREAGWRAIDDAAKTGD